MPLVALLFVLFSALVVPVPAFAQSCRRSCQPDETRDANGCCVSAGGSRPAATPNPLPRRCPSGTTWSDRERACVGRTTCPGGSHPESGGRCVADAVGCPPGSRNEEGRCVADITCPQGSHLEGNACVAEVQCPPGTRYENNLCVSSDVQCPPGTTRQGTGCVGNPVCAEGSTFVQGRGCLATTSCPVGTHLEQGACVSDGACIEGQRFQGGRCVNVCGEFEHTRWSSEQRACVCEAGFTAIEGRCVPATNCPDGTHLEAQGCVADIVCPYGYRFVRGTGCIDPEAAVRLREEANRIRREEEDRRALRWGGFAIQPWFGIGGGYIASSYAANAFFRHQMNVPPSQAEPLFATRSAEWSGITYNAGIAVAFQPLILQIAYTRMEPNLSGRVNADACRALSMNEARNSNTCWELTPNPLNLLSFQIGPQGVGRIHAWRFFVGAGMDLGGPGKVLPAASRITTADLRVLDPNLPSQHVFNGIFAQFGYRSTFRIVHGLFVGAEVEGMIGGRPAGPFGGTACYLNTHNTDVVDTTCSERWLRQFPQPTEALPYGDGTARLREGGNPPSNAIFVGFNAMIFVGYSIH